MITKTLVKYQVMGVSWKGNGYLRVIRGRLLAPLLAQVLQERGFHPASGHLMVAARPCLKLGVMKSSGAVERAGS